MSREQVNSTMAHEVQLLGGFRLRKGTSYQQLAFTKQTCLLAYLAYSSAWVSRERLAFLFWPDTDDASARRNLRQLLSRVKHLKVSPEVDVEATRLRWPVSTDVAAFRQALGRQDWKVAIRLYRGDLLADFAPSRDDGFSAWLELEREHLKNAHQEACQHQAQELEAAQHFAGVLPVLQPLLEGEELLEDVLQQYMRCAYLAGQREQALQAYEQFASALKRELDLAPLASTLELLRVIRGESASFVLSPVVPQTAARIPVTVSRPPSLVGREEEIRQILVCDTPLLLIAGEAGAGKSRLMDELAEGALRLACREGLQDVPYYPVIQMIQECLRRAVSLPDLGSYQDDIVRLIPEFNPALTPQVASDSNSKPRLLEALARFIEGLTPPDERFSLVADDLQWADSATLELLRFMVHRSAVRILAAYRLHEMTAELQRLCQHLRTAHLLTEISLTPLSEAAMTELLASLIQTPSGPAIFSRWLQQKTGGNPMFALETLKAFFEAGVLTDDTEGWHSHLDDITEDYRELETPPVVQEVIARRLARLSEESQRVLQVAAVLHEGFTPTHLSVVAGLSVWRVLEALEEAEAAGIIADGAFRHDLLRQTVYVGIGKSRRKLLHGLVAESLRADTDPLVVAEHFLIAEQADAALACWLEVSKTLLERGLYHDAVTILERARTLTCPQDDCWLLLSRLAHCYRTIARHDEAEQLTTHILAYCQDAEARLSAMETKAANALKQGRLQDAEQWCHRALKLDATLGHKLNRSLTGLLAYAIKYQGRQQEALELLLPFLEPFREKGKLSELCTLLTNIATLYDDLEQSEQALPLHNEALKLVKQLKQPYQQVDITLNLLYCLTNLGRAGEVLELADEALKLGRFEGTDILRNNLGAALQQLGDYPKAARHFEILTKDSEDPTLMCLAWGRLVELYMRLGRSSEAVQALEKALTASAQTDYAVAKARVVISGLLHGTHEQLKQVNDLLAQLDIDTLQSYLKEELARAMASRGA